ncbi:hypothetical protein ACFVHW_07210 [Streptomyces sp. NPDC127110]|uniref:hypothetical protein n=1 Tax=Streptomyces sp. NPDC127110 TaxID=3345362 RepID=UPI003640EA51
MTPETITTRILADTVQGAEDNRATALDTSIPAEDRRDAAQAADSSWRGIAAVARRLAEACEQEGNALEPELLALDPDDFSQEAMDLDSRSRVWSELARELDALALRAAGRQNAEQRLNAELADF